VDRSPVRDSLRIAPVARLAALAAVGSLVPLARRQEPADEPRLDLGPSYAQSVWTIEDGLPQSTVTALAQARDGYLWIGTFGGLARFDGVRFETFDIANTPELASNRILSLLEDSRGTLWIGTVGAGVTRRRGGSFEHLPPGESAPRGEVWAMAEDASGAVWLGGEGLVRIAADGARSFPSLDDEPEAAVRDLLVDRDGTLWIATASGLARRTDERLEVLDRRGTWKLAERGDGSIWAHRGSTGRSIWRDGELLEVSDADPSIVWDMTTDRQGCTWFARESGLFRARASPQAPVGPLALESVLRSDGARRGSRSVLEDREGNLWIGTNGRGLVRLREMPFVHLDSTRRFPGESTSLVTPWGPSAVLVRSGSGALTRLEGDRVVRGLPAGMPQPWGDTDLVLDRSGVAWMIGTDGRLLRWDGRETQELEHSLTDPTVLHEDAAGTLWIGARGALGRVVADGVETTALPGAGAVACIRDGPDGALWAVAEGPLLARLAPGEREPRLWRAGLPRGAPRGLHVDGAGVAWVTTYGSGLARVEGDRIDVLTTDQGLPNDSLGGVLEDARGGLWINSNRGVFHVLRRELEDCLDGRVARAHCVLLATGEGNGASACRTTDGRLWFPTIHGLAVVEPERARPNPVPPRVAIERLRVGGELYGPAGDVVVPPGANDISIDYTALTFTASARARFRYILEGHDRRWIEAGTRRTALYTNVPPGSYRFRVAACNEDQVWSLADASVGLELLPFFTQTRLFFGSVALLVVASAFGAHRLRLRTLERHNVALRREMDERERAEGEKRVLEEHLREAQRLEAVGRLAGGIAHDFNNLLTVLIGRAELLHAQAGASTEVAEHAREILSSGRRAAALTSQLLAFSRKQVLRPRVVDPNDVLRGLEPLLARLIPESIALELRLADEVGAVVVDPHQLERVVMNLVVNAKDALPDGGRVVVATRRIELGAEALRSVEGAQPGPYVEISVLDSGRGIGAQDLPRVFEPFFTTKPVGGGTGLGLASVHGIVQQSGGHVTVESEPGQGAAFHVRLPAVDLVPEPLALLPESEPPRVAAGGTILVCDDDAAVLRVIETTLRRNGYEVLAAGHPDAALRIAREHAGPIDLLITDVVMPGMDGVRLASEVERARGSVRVLFLSGYPAAKDRGEALVEGEREFLQKPYAPPDLLRSVRALLERAST